MSTPSTLVADRYRLVKMLGAGGMGIVWQAWDERLHRAVALKLLRTHPELTDAERELSTDRAMREARITAGLHHPAAVTVFDVVEHDGQPCIVMQLIDSTPLSVLLSEHGTLTPSATARIGAQVASALAAAHKLRIVHRDVKPGNILITADGSAMISDFGISHALGDATITATGMIHGTPAYLAPEVARGFPTSFASDVFSLGSTLYAMLEGTPPFGSDKNAIALLHRVARGGYLPPAHAGPLAPLLAEMLSTSPKRRPSMVSVAESLSALQEDPDIAAGLPAGIAVLTEPAADGPGAGDDATTEAVEQQPPTPTTVAAAVATVPAAAQQTPAAPTASAVPTLPAPAPETPTAPTAAAVPTLRAPAPETPTPPTAETLRVDQPTRYEPPTAETEKLAGAGVSAAAAAAVSAPADKAASPASPPPTVSNPENPPRRGRRVGVIVGILVLVGALLVGAAMLLSTLRPDVDQEAGPTESPAPSEVAETPTADAAPPAPTEAVTPSAEPEPEPEPEPPPPTPEQRAVEMLSSYYAMLPNDLDSAWPSMTADYQENHAGGRGGYEAFWSNVSALEIADVTASAPDRAQATLTYHFRDGRVVQEVTSFRLVDEGGALKIAETDVLSSSQL